jgi:hypothetical protein
LPDRAWQLLGLFVDRVLAAETAILLELQLVGSILLVLGRRVVALLALGAGKSHYVAHLFTLGAPPGRAGRLLKLKLGGSELTR